MKFRTENWLFTSSPVRVLVAIGLVALSASAQTGRGAITGRVVDISGAVLQGARVQVQQPSAFAVTDTQGEFTITDLPPGRYTVSVFYLGFAARPPARMVGDFKKKGLLRRDQFRMTLPLQNGALSADREGDRVCAPGRNDRSGVDRQRV